MSSSSTFKNPSLVNIGTHSLALYTHGPEPTNPSQPVVLFVSGIASSSFNWAAVVRLLPSPIRSYTYDRAGFTNSESSPQPPTAENIARELSLLINKAPITNPLIIVGHSWAGVLINEFIALTGNGPHIAGLVLVDANPAIMLATLNPNNPDLQAISIGVEHYAAKGITAEHKLTPEEWDAFTRDESTEKYLLQAAKEENEYTPSFEILLKKELWKKQPILGNKPVYVIGGMRSRDWSRMYKAGLERGNGTEEQRRRVRELIEIADGKSEKLMKEHLKMSTNAKAVWARESGHFVQLTQPDVVVEGVKWVFNELQNTSSI